MLTSLHPVLPSPAPSSPSIAPESGVRRVATDAGLKDPEKLPLVPSVAGVVVQIAEAALRLAATAVPLVFTSVYTNLARQLAYRMHQASARSGASFVVVGATEAWTVSAAHRTCVLPSLDRLRSSRVGTLVLEDPGALSRQDQRLLLAAIDGWSRDQARDGAAATHIVTSAKEPLEVAISSGALDRSLYFRLHGSKLSLPLIDLHNDVVFRVLCDGWSSLTAPNTSLSRAAVRRLSPLLKAGDLSVEEQVLMVILNNAFDAHSLMAPAPLSP
jgi:transcriptional regulator of acetoin/glycerol metabolism